MKHRLTFYILAAFALLLLLWGFFTPPQGEIHRSVLIGVSEIFCFTALYELPAAIHEATSVRIKHNNTELEISKDSEHVEHSEA